MPTSLVIGAFPRRRSGWAVGRFAAAYRFGRVQEIFAI